MRYDGRGVAGVTLAPMEQRGWGLAPKWAGLGAKEEGHKRSCPTGSYKLRDAWIESKPPGGEYVPTPSQTMQTDQTDNGQ